MFPPPNVSVFRLVNSSIQCQRQRHLRAQCSGSACSRMLAGSRGRVPAIRGHSSGPTPFRRRPLGHTHMPRGEGFNPRTRPRRACRSLIMGDEISRLWNRRVPRLGGTVLSTIASMESALQGWPLADDIQPRSTAGWERLRSVSCGETGKLIRRAWLSRKDLTGGIFRGRTFFGTIERGTQDSI